MGRRISVLLALSALLLTAGYVFAVTLFSEGFESQTLSGWSSSGGSATATASQEIAHNGSYSIKVSHDKTSSYGYQITIQNIEPGMFYEASAYGKSQDPNINTLFIRVAWYSSSDGSGSQLSAPNDSNQGSSGADWLQLSTGAVQAPSNANSAKLRLVLTSKTAGQLASAYYDDVLFNEATAPMPSPSPTPTSTPIKSPSPSPIALPKSPAPTPSPLKSPSPDPSSVLGESSQSASPEPTPGPATKDQNANSDGPKTAIILIGLGLILIGLASASYVWYSKLLGKSQARKKDENEND